MILRCTRKLIKIFNLTIVEDITSDDNIFSEWYANLIYIEGKKCILFTESKTLYSILLPDIKKADIIDIGEIFYNQLHKSFLHIGIKEELIIKMVLNPKEIYYTKTQSMSILGSMNEYAFQYKYYFGERGGIKFANIYHIIRKVNETPMGQIQYNSGNELVKMIFNENFA